MISSDKMFDTFVFSIDGTWILEVKSGFFVCVKHLLTTRMAHILQIHRGMLFFAVSHH